MLPTRVLAAGGGTVTPDWRAALNEVTEELSAETQGTGRPKMRVAGHPGVNRAALARFEKEGVLARRAGKTGLALARRDALIGHARFFWKSGNNPLRACMSDNLDAIYLAVCVHCS